MARIKNLNATLKRLDRIGPAALRAVRRALAAQAAFVVSRMKDAVPVDTGLLKDSIRWTFGGVLKGALKLGEVIADRGTARVTIYAGNAAAFYASFVEHGTSRNVAQPFFFPTWRALRGGVRIVIRTTFTSAARLAFG